MAIKRGGLDTGRWPGGGHVLHLIKQCVIIF